jgi:hypothetical protein
MGLRLTKIHENAVVGRRKRLPHVGSLWGRRFRLPSSTELVPYAFSITST